MYLKNTNLFFIIVRIRMVVGLVSNDNHSNVTQIQKLI